AGVAFRGEFDPASLIGDYAAGLLGYGSGRTVALIGVFAPGTTIYNDKLTLQTDATLEGHMDLSGLGPLFNTVTLGNDLTIGIQLDTQAPNSQTGGVFNYGIKAYVSGSMAVSQDLLGKPLNLSLSALFEYSTQSQAAFVTFQATAAGAWTDLQSLDGFSAQSVDILLRFSTEPSAQSAKLVVSGHFSNAHVSGPTFDVSFDITAKNQDISIAASIGVSGQVSVQDLIDAFQGIVAPDLPPTETWSALDSIALDGLSVQVRVGTDGVKLYAEAGATVLGLETSVALYVGPDATQQGKYGVLLAARRQGSLVLGELVPGLPQDIPVVTLPDTIFYFSSLRFDADRLHYPTPALFDFFNAVWGTGGEVNEKITIEAGAGLVSSIPTGGIVPAEVSDFLRDALWVDVNKPVVIAGNVPLFGKTKLGLTVYLPESRPDPAGDAAPEFFEYGSFFLHMEADQQQLLLSVSGNLGIRLRKPGVPAPTSGPYVESNYDHLVLSAAASLEVNLGPPPTVQVTLQGAVTAPDGFQPFGLDWLEFNNLTLQISLATTPGGNVAIKLGIRTSFAIGQPPEQLDIDASLLISVQTLQVFPWATVKLNGVRLQSNRGLETDDLLALADLFTGQSLNIPVPSTFPNIAIRNFEISYS
ncbi:MAG: hypothetical protein ACE5EF_13290, partial [Dehalococcoidia bacterium]